jgi:aspartyl aminopeptidase
MGTEIPPDGLATFLDRGVTPGHAVTAAAAILESGGFARLEEGLGWDELPERFIVRRGQGTLAAVVRGTLPPEESGFRIIGTHTDFPGFRLKPRPFREAEGVCILGVEVYGGPIIATWFDRDLTLAGSLVWRSGGGLLRQTLFDLERPLCRISMPAIHLNRGVNDDGFTFNKEDNLCPIVGGPQSSKIMTDEIGAACGVEPSSVVAFSGHLRDCQRASVGGASGEYVFSGRIDNLAMCYAAIEALRSSRAGAATAIACLFDSEEAGSSTYSGAGSRFLDDVLERLCARGGAESLYRSRPRSVIVSADGAHAVHPCYPAKHEKANRPILNGGPVVKSNAQERYTSTALTAAYFGECAAAASVRIQDFVSRNDIQCGSTIGPVLSTRLGICSVDVGNPMLSMHSIREMAGTKDTDSMISVLRVHLEGSVPFRAD